LRCRRRGPLDRGIVAAGAPAGLDQPRAIVCAPSDLNAEARANLIDAVRRSGVWQIKILPGPLTSVVGAGIDISSSYAQMHVDIGDGVKDLAVIRARRIVTTRTTRHLRSALQALVQQRRNLFLRRREAERLVNPASSAYVILVDSCRRWHLTPTAWT